MARFRSGLPVGCVVIGIAAGLALTGRAESMPEVVIPPATSTTTSTIAMSATRPSTTVAQTTTSTSTTSSSALTNVDAKSAVVVVVNGTSTPGLAGRASAALRANGWQFVFAGDTRADVAISSVYAAPGFEDAAADTATALGLELEVQPMESAPALRDDSTGDVLIVLGPETAA